MKCLKCGLKDVQLIDRGEGQHECPQCGWLHNDMDIAMESRKEQEIASPQAVAEFDFTGVAWRREVARQLGIDDYPAQPKLTERPN